MTSASNFKAAADVLLSAYSSLTHSVAFSDLLSAYSFAFSDLLPLPFNVLSTLNVFLSISHDDFG